MRIRCAIPSGRPPRLPVHVLCLILGLILSFPQAVAAASIKGQKPMMVIGDVFRFTPGAWAVYSIRERVHNERYRMYIATLQKTERNGKPCSWMEVEVTPEKAGKITSRFLVEETKDGPGELFEVIVQIKGYAPFVVPRAFYEGKEKEIGEFETSYVARRGGKRTVAVNGRTVAVWEVEATDNKARQIKALVSDQIPPLGVVNAESEKTAIFLESWGGDASTKIEGAPINFFLWLVTAVGQTIIK